MLLSGGEPAPRTNCNNAVSPWLFCSIAREGDSSIVMVVIVDMVGLLFVLRIPPL